MSRANRSGSAAARARQRERTLLISLLVIAAILRLLYVSELHGNPFFDYPIIDAAEYKGWATTIAHGEALWSRIHIHGPLYPYILAALIDRGSSFQGFYVFNHILGLLSLALLYRAGRIVGGRNTGFAALGIGILYSRFIYFEGQILATTLAVFLDTLLLVITLELGLRRAKPPLWSAAGVVLGLSAITRPTILIAAPVFLFWAWWQSSGMTGRGGQGDSGASRPITALLAPLFLLVGCTAVIAPVAMRNAAVGDPILIQANGGMNFYIANRIEADGLASVRPGTEWRTIERIATSEGAIREVDRDRFYYRLAAEEMRSDPARAAARFGKRALLFLGGWEIDTSQDFEYFRDQSFVLKILALPAGLVMPFLILGGYRAIRKRGMALLPLLFVAFYMVAVILFPYSSRYRMPLFPTLAVLAAFAAAPLYRAGRAGRFPRMQGLVLMALFILLNFFPVDLPDKGIVRTHFHLGKRLSDRGAHKEALKEYDRAIEWRGGDGDIWNDRGLAWEALGDIDAAEQDYRRAIDAVSDHGKARANLAGIHYRAGRNEEAMAELRRAIDLEPLNGDFYNNLGVLQLRAGDIGGAVLTLEAGAQLDPGNRETLYNLGSSYERANRLADGAAIFERLAGLGDNQEIRCRLARLAEKRGSPEGAAVEYGKALAFDPDYPDALRGLGVLRLRGGNRARGISLLERYLVARPEDESVRALISEARAGGN